MMDNSLSERLMQRHKERLESMEKRRETRRKDQILNGESTSIFLEDFNKAKREVTTSLNRLNIPTSEIELSTEFSEIIRKIQNIQKFISDASTYLPSYDLRRAQEIVGELRTEINTKRDVLLPKKKFAFKSRQKYKTSLKNTDVGKIETTPVKIYCDRPNEGLGFSNLSGETLSLTEEQCNEKDINISNLVDCVVYIYGYPSALRIQNVVNSEIYCGPVSRSIFVVDCCDSIFHLACQQLRVHATVTTNFFIHVTCKAIIEDCEEVGFGLYHWTYPLLNEHYHLAGLDINKNNWKLIDDFNWLKLDEKSPNWFTIE